MYYATKIILIIISFYNYPSLVSSSPNQGQCRVNAWTEWSRCSQDCGSDGVQKRTRTLMYSTPGYKCSFPLKDERVCNRFCQHGGKLNPQGCKCHWPFYGKCCQIKSVGNGNGKKPASTTRSTYQQNVIICEGATKKIECSGRATIKVIDAFYGRITRDLCPGSKTHVTNCRSSKSKSIIQRDCDNKRSCVLFASNSRFGDPCIGTTKFINIKYECFTKYPCKDYKSENNYQRSTVFILPKGTRGHGDRNFAPGWYRFTSGAGGKMPTTCPKARACGSTAPVYLDGDDHPKDVGVEAVSKTCVRTETKCCASHESNVKIRKCSQNGEEFFVYYLERTSSHDMSYCAGSRKKCEGEETSETGFEPCSSEYPQIVKHPEVTVDVKDKRIRFKCKSFPKDTSDNVYHEVTWFQEGPPDKRIQLPTQVLENGETEAFLQNNHTFGEKPLFCLGHNIFCKVKSYFKDKKKPSPDRHSNRFFAGFKVSPKTLDLSEKDKPHKVTITNTIPIVCQDGLENCNVIIEVGQTKTDSFVDYCTVRFQPGPRGRKKEIQVVAKRDFVDDGNQEMFLKLYVPRHVNPVDWNCHKNITDFKVITKDVKTSRCTSTGDPHIRTFDGLFYNHFSVGDYVLVDSKARKFKIHVRTWVCHTVSCNCGVAVQEGDDVVVVDMCRDHIPRARFASSVEPQPGTRITRNDNGKSFVLDFPSGAFVKFTSKRWFGRWYFADFEIQLPSDDYKNTSGLCGTFDGNRNNDMKDRSGKVHKTGWRRRTAPREFTEDWKIPVGKSLFYYKDNNQKKCLGTRAKTYCTCQETCCDKRTIHCDFQGYSQRPKYKHGFRGWKELTFPGAEHCGRRKRRSTGDNTIVLPDDGDSARYTYNYEKFTPNEGTWPTTKNKITEQEAKNHCRDTIVNSKIATICKKLIAGFNLDEFIEQCVTDVKILDSKKAASDSAISTVASVCEEKTLREIKIYWKNDTSGNMAPPTEVGDSACPNECNGNGRCVNATCICNKDYITDDCSMKKGQAPILLGIPKYREEPSNGLCDIRDRDCIRTRVSGYDFIDTSGLACQAQEVKISGDEPEAFGRKYVETADMLSFGEISCLLPNVPVVINGNPETSRGKPVGGFYIKVSNDGKTFSKNKTLLMVYDSKCMQCKETGTCIWKKNSCKVNDYCFADGDANPSDWCEICDSTVKRDGFVRRKVNSKPYFKSAKLQHIFKGQTWKFTIPAKDDDKTPLKYYFIGDDYNMDISSAGILTWKPNSIGVFSFTIKVEDPCGESAQQEFKVQTHQCKCEGKNGGICKWNSLPGDVNKTECVCPDGCQGESCLDPVEGRICRIISDKVKGEDEGSNTAVIVILILLFLIILILLLIAIYVVHYLKKRKQPFSRDGVKEATLSLGRDAKKRMTGGAIKAYNKAHKMKDKNNQMKFYNGEDGSQVNPGYEG